MLRSSSYWKIQSLYRKWKIEERVYAFRSALHLPIERYEPVIQDVEIPMKKASEFLEFYFREINIRPCWICPMRPLEAARNWTLFAMEPGALYLNFGFWGSVRTRSNEVTGISIAVSKASCRISVDASRFIRHHSSRKTNSGAYTTGMRIRSSGEIRPSGAFQSLYQKAVLGIDGHLKALLSFMVRQ